MLDRRRSVDIPQLLCIEAGALDRVGGILSGHGVAAGASVAVVSGRGATSAIAKSVLTSLEDRGDDVTHLEIDSKSLADAKRLRRALVDGPAELVLAIGGGRVLDMAKVAASLVLPLVTVPTALSHDGVCSPVASLVDHRRRATSVGTGTPFGVIIDPEAVLRTAPESLSAGLGDLLSNLVAIEDWRFAARERGEPVDEYAAHVAEASALSVLGLRELDSPAAAETLARGLVLSGLAMSVAGSSRPCSGGEHLISHALDAVLGTRSLPHGYQVALGSILLAELHGRYGSELRATFERCGVPYRCRDLGIRVDEVRQAIRRAPTMRPDRYSILSTPGLGAAGEAESLVRLVA